MPSWELFQDQDQAYHDQVLPPAVTARVVVEAGIRQGWDQYIGVHGQFVGMHGFGLAGCALQVFWHYDRERHQPRQASFGPRLRIVRFSAAVFACHWLRQRLFEPLACGQNHLHPAVVEVQSGMNPRIGQLSEWRSAMGATAARRRQRVDCLAGGAPWLLEPFVVPSGSMAPTLLGVHADVVCPKCGYRFEYGLDDGPAGRVLCPNCQHVQIETARRRPSREIGCWSIAVLFVGAPRDVGRWSRFGRNRRPARLP